MHCSHAKTDIALLVGGDLDQEAVVPLQSHLDCCTDCAAYFYSLRRNLGVLRAVQEVPYDPRDSVWPRLVPALNYSEQQRRVRQFNGWVASVAVAAICLAMVTLSAESRRNAGSPYTQDQASSYRRVFVPRPTPRRTAEPGGPVRGTMPADFDQAADWPGKLDSLDEMRWLWYPYNPQR